MSKREDVESFIRQVLERTDRIDNITNVVGINRSDLTDQVAVSYTHLKSWTFNYRPRD